MKVLILVFTILFVSFVFCQKTSGSFSRVIYGNDDRLDYFEVSSTLQSRGDGAVVLLRGSNILTENNDGSFTATSTDTAEVFWDYCPNERYSEQLILSNAFSFCSGFLLSSNPGWIGTAAHCVENGISDIVVIFGFELISSGNTRLTFAANDVYTPSSIIVQGIPSGEDRDFAVIQLDRAVTGHTPYTSYRSASVGQSMTLIGHPTGLPKKFDSGGVVRSVTSTLIRGTCDSYGGNSGSPILDNSGNLIGILVGGAPDFVQDGSCDVSNVCPGGVGCEDDGENIVPICDLLSFSSVLSNQLGFCTNTPDSNSFSTNTNSFTTYTVSINDEDDDGLFDDDDSESALSPATVSYSLGTFSNDVPSSSSDSSTILITLPIFILGIILNI